MAANTAAPSSEGFRLARLPRNGFEELFLTGCAGDPTDLACALAQLKREHSGELTILRADVFGSATSPRPAAHVAAEFGFPVTWVLSDDGIEYGLGGMHLHAVVGVELRPIALDGEIVGNIIETADATEVMLGGIRAADTSQPRPAQARATFERMEQALGCVGMDFSHVARTWLYLDDILAWYGDFNRVRTGFFNERGVFDGLVPASTGIGGSNPSGAAMETALYAVKPKHSGVHVAAIPSPLQCPALEYGSSFSRAVEVAMPDHRRVFISGTASIAPDGKTVYLGDMDMQVARTCEVVAAILESRGMGWEHVTRAVAYVRYPQEAGALERHCAASGMPGLPLIAANNTICRDDLLFELEVDAACGV